MGAEIVTSPWSIAPRTMDEALRFAEMLAKSDLVPKDYKGKPGNVIVAIQMGSELGLSPMQAIQNIAVINGRASVYGDAMLALVLSRPECEDVQETDDGATATCTVLRKGHKPVVRTFSTEDAKLAGLAGKDLWRAYPKRMRQMRARGFALRDAFADALRGLHLAEESQDIPTTATIVESAPAQAVDAKALPESTAPQPPPAASEPYRFKSGSKEGKLITDDVAVPTAYLVDLRNRGKMNANLRRVVDAELARRNSNAYIGEKLQMSLDQRAAAKEREEAERMQSLSVEGSDPWGLASPDDEHDPAGESA